MDLHAQLYQLTTPILNFSYSDWYYMILLYTTLQLPIVTLQLPIVALHHKRNMWLFLELYATLMPMLTVY